MPRPLRGRIIARRLADDTLVFDVRIHNDARTVGREPEWSKSRAQALLDHTLLPAAQLGQDWTQLVPTGAPSPGA